MKDIIKAILALVFVAALAVGVFYDGDLKLKQPTSKPVVKQTYVPKARMDINTPNGKEQLLKVNFKDKEISKAEWSKEKEWYTVQSSDKPLKFTVKANKETDVRVELRGPYEKNKDGKMVEHWVKYSSVKIDGKEILSPPQEVWHNKAHVHTMKLKKGKTYQIEATWEPK